MATIKEDITHLIKRLPDDCTLEDVQYHLYVLQKLQRGEQEIQEGKGFSHEQAKSRLSRWIAG